MISSKHRCAKEKPHRAAITLRFVSTMQNKSCQNEHLSKNEIEKEEGGKKAHKVSDKRAV